MNKIGIIGTKSYSNNISLTKLFSHIQNNFIKNATICTGGNTTGCEYIAKKYALELGLNYKEFNPSYTGWNIYSAESEEYYGKDFHISHMYHRYKQLINYCDYLFIFIEKNHYVIPELKYALKYAEERSNIKMRIIN